MNEPYTIEFVEYECGCIGFPPDENGKAWILDCCDKEHDDFLCFTNRLMQKRSIKDPSNSKNYKLLTPDGIKIVISKIQKQLSDGENFTRIQRAFMSPINTDLYHLDKLGFNRPFSPTPGIANRGDENDTLPHD